MTLPTPHAGADLPIALARQFALDEIGARLSADPRLAASFWEEVNGSTPPASPDITVCYCFLRRRNASFTLLEFVSGQTLEQICTQADPSSCERAIPLFSRLLDAWEESTTEVKKPAKPRLLPGKGLGGGQLRLADFGIARASYPLTGKLYGTVMIGPDGSWSEEILSEGAGRSAVYPLLMAVYKELLGKLPAATALSPAQIGSFSKRSLARPTAVDLAKIVQRRALPYLAATGAGLLLILGLFGSGHFLANIVAWRRPAGLNLPPPPPAVVSEPAPLAPKPPNPVVEAIVVNEGLTHGPRLLRQIVPEYPPLAREQNISGVVKLRITVAKDGSIRSARVLSGDPRLRDGAVEAVKKWVYKPAEVNGKPIAATTEVEIKFDLAAQGR